MASFLECITQHHRGNGEQSECVKRIHVWLSVFMREVLTAALQLKKRARTASGLFGNIVGSYCWLKAGAVLC